MIGHFVKVKLSCGCWVMAPKSSQARILCVTHDLGMTYDDSFVYFAEPTTDPAVMSCCGAPKKWDRDDDEPCWNCGAI